MSQSMQLELTGERDNRAIQLRDFIAACFTQALENPDALGQLLHVCTQYRADCIALYSGVQEGRIELDDYCYKYFGLIELAVDRGAARADYDLDIQQRVAQYFRLEYEVGMQMEDQNRMQLAAQLLLTLAALNERYYEGLGISREGADFMASTVLDGDPWQMPVDDDEEFPKIASMEYRAAVRQCAQIERAISRSLESMQLEREGADAAQIAGDSELRGRAVMYTTVGIELAERWKVPAEQDRGPSVWNVNRVLSHLHERLAYHQQFADRRPGDREIVRNYFRSLFLGLDSRDPAALTSVARGLHELALTIKSTPDEEQSGVSE